VSGQLNAPAALPPWKNTGYRWIWGCVDHGAGLFAWEKINIHWS